MRANPNKLNKTLLEPPPWSVHLLQPNCSELTHPRATTQVPSSRSYKFHRSPHRPTEYKEAFALFDKRGTGAVPRETLGDLLRALGQNPTQSEVAEIVAAAPRDGASQSLFAVYHITQFHPVDYKTFLAILNRPDGFKPAGTPGAPRIN